MGCPARKAGGKRPGDCDMNGATNRYCSRCLRTRRFYEIEDHFECERCRKTLYKVTRPEALKS